MPLPPALQLVHAYPSALNATVTAAVALLAGGTPARAALLAGAMLLLQFAIGAANDWADAPADTISRPAKPIVSGAVRRAWAARVAIVCAAAGLLLAAQAGPLAAAIGSAGLLAGLAYDLALKPTLWAWLPFSAGFLLLPLFAWLGAAASAPPFGLWIAALALPAGAAVSLSNGLIDEENDRRAGQRGPAVRLGPRATLRLLLVLHLILVAGVAVSLLDRGRAGLGVWVAVACAGALIGGGRLIAGGRLIGGGRLIAGVATRERRLLGWRVQAFGLALLAGAWFSGMVG